MENLSLSRQPNKSSTKKACNGGGGRTNYDDVFGGPPKFGVPSLAPRVDDYAEIFGGFHAARGGGGSIPVLDLPVVEEEDVFFDVSSTGFDYEEVFGGCGRGFGVSFEELMMKMEADEEEANGGGDDGDSSDEAWTPAESESLEEELDNLENNQSLSNGDSYESIDDDMEFNISYHKANQISTEDFSNGVTHLTQLQDVSGYAFLVNKNTYLGKADGENPSLQITDDDDDIQMDFSGTQKNLRKTMFHPTDSSTFEQTFENGCKVQRGFERNCSHANESFVTISEINLRTQPSDVPPPRRPAPLLGVKKGDFSELAEVYKNVSSEQTEGDNSPPYFDVEVDASSSAAVSAATMKDVMEKAQESLKNAKELLERKRERRGSRTERKDKEGKMFSSVDYLNMKDEREHATYERPENGMSFSGRDERPKVSKTTKPVSEFFGGQKVANVDITSETCRQSDRLDGASEWKEASQFFELVRTNGSKTSDEEDGDEILVSKTKVQDLRQMDKNGITKAVDRSQVIDKKTKANCEDFQMEGNVSKVKVTGVLREQLENNGNSEASKAAHGHYGPDKKKNLVQAIFELGEDEKFRIAGSEVENQKKPAKDQSAKPEYMVVEVKQKDNGLEAENSVKHTENELLWEEVNRHMANERRSKGSSERKGDEKKRRAASKFEESDRKLKEALEQMEKEKRLNEVWEREEHEKRVREACEREEREKRVREAREWEEREKRGRKAREREEREKREREAQEMEEREKRAREARAREEREKIEAREREEREKKARAAREREEREKKEAWEREEREKRARETREREEREKRAREAHEREEREKRARETLEREEREKREACEREEKENRLREARELEVREKRAREELKQLKNERKLKEEYEKNRMEALQKLENESRVKEESWKKQKEQIENERRLKKSQEQETNEKKQRQGLERVENEKSQKEANDLLDAKDEELDSLWEEENTAEFGLKEPIEKEGTENISKQARIETEDRLNKEGGAEDLKALSRAFELLVEDDLRPSDEACVLDETGNPQLASRHEEHSNNVSKNGAFAHRGNSKMQTMNNSAMGSETAEAEKIKVERPFEVPGIAQGNIGQERRPSSMADVEPSVQSRSAKRASEFEKRQSASQMDSGTERKEKKIADEWGQNENYGMECQVDSNRKETVEKITPTRPAGAVQNGRKADSTQPSVVMEGKANIHVAAQWVNASQNAARKDMKINNTPIPEEREDARMKRERELEKERLRKIEEEREREREREKDRMAVDLATLEAREKAERNAVERAAKQRALAEARERLDKVCAEAKEMNFAERSATEARIKAERAAVERATAEARERAVEKAKAERAAFESRERFERTYSEKFSVSSRSGPMRTSSSSSDLQDQKYQSASSFGSSKYQYSSVNGAIYNANRAEGVEGESAQRCKARLERHQRTAERAAKALAEKNMRDLLAQREQAERNRLAETLDADVKRWSSGKEGNLRALLSTLQYILGPDSGWHPIPLTEVITSAAVKKAYRKATLCVHPDKLQQRGASIQQKYVCEKVFDLLKEAWNKFNSEER